jgi:hypothetical protein
MGDQRSCTSQTEDREIENAHARTHTHTGTGSAKGWLPQSWNITIQPYCQEKELPGIEYEPLCREFCYTDDYWKVGTSSYFV